MLALWLSAGCGSQCASGWTADPTRVAVLETLAGRPIAAQVCFGSVPEHGVTTGTTFLLERSDDDRLLAARVLHLSHHRAPAEGPACRETLLQEEAEAWRIELAHRVDLGVIDPVCPAVEALGATPTTLALRSWLEQNDGPIPRALRASHRTRCR